MALEGGKELAGGRLPELDRLLEPEARLPSGLHATL